MSEAEFNSFDPRRAEFAARLADIERAPDTLRAIVAAAGLRPEADLRFGDLADCDFDADDLRGFDFTGCDLMRSTFVGARIRGAKFDCARYDPRALAKADDYAEFEADDAKRGPADRFDPAGLRRFAPFREGPFAPEMLVLPAGEFAMGSDLGDLELDDDDRAYEDEVVPGQGKRRMRIARRFALGKYPVTFEEYDVFADATGRERPGDENWGRARRPVVDVDWDDATAYVGWLNERLGNRLLSAALRGGMGICVPGGDEHAALVGRRLGSRAREWRREIRGWADFAGGQVRAQSLGFARHDRQRLGMVRGRLGGHHRRFAGGRRAFRFSEQEFANEASYNTNFRGNRRG